MAFLAIFTADMSKETYDTLIAEFSWKDFNPKGAVFHAAAFDDKGGIHVADVWESQEELDAFVGAQLVPTFQKHNVPLPSVEIFPVHNIQVQPAVDKYKPS